MTGVATLDENAPLGTIDTLPMHYLTSRWLCIPCHRAWHAVNEAKNLDGEPPRSEWGKKVAASHKRHKGVWRWIRWNDLKL